MLLWSRTPTWKHSLWEWAPSRIHGRRHTFCIYSMKKILSCTLKNQCNHKFGGTHSIPYEKLHRLIDFSFLTFLFLILSDLDLRVVLVKIQIWHQLSFQTMKIAIDRKVQKHFFGFLVTEHAIRFFFFDLRSSYFPIGVSWFWSRKKIEWKWKPSYDWMMVLFETLIFYGFYTWISKRITSYLSNYPGII